MHQEVQGDIYLPPPVPLPFRFEFTTTSVQDLINALERALQEESNHGEAPRLPTLPIPVPNFLDFEQYLLEIEARSDEFLEKMKISTDAELRLSRMIRGKSWLESVRLFMMLLFLAQRMDIDLDQDEDETEITIKVRTKTL